MNRRRFLALAGSGTAAALGGAGYGIWRLVDEPAPPEPAGHAFRSRPDLRPPNVAIDRGAGALPPGLALYAPMGGPAQTGAMIFGADGEPVWFRPNEPGQALLNVRVQRYGGEPVLTFWDGHVGKGYGKGDGVLLDSSYREVARLRGGNGHRLDLHELLLTPEGTALVTSYRIVRRDLRRLGGARNGRVIEGIVQELDVATGRVVLEWRSLEHVPPDESRRKVPAKPDDLFDYLHVNSVDLDADGNLLVSARHTWCVYKLDRRTGAVLWRLGGKRSDFRLGPGVRFAWQHDARRVPDGSLTIFDNGASPKVEPQSRALVLDVDEEARVARLARAYTDGQLATAMGNMQTLRDGSVFVGWGTRPVATLFAADGTRLLEATLPAEARSYRAFWSEWRATPPEPPAVAAFRAAGRPAVAVSWNGATDVARWRVEAGADPAALEVAAEVARAGFETEVELERHHRHAAATALDAGGRELARSRTVALTPVA